MVTHSCRLLTSSFLTHPVRLWAHLTGIHFAVSWTVHTSQQRWLGFFTLLLPTCWGLQITFRRHFDCLDNTETLSKTFCSCLAAAVSTSIWVVSVILMLHAAAQEDFLAECESVVPTCTWTNVLLINPLRHTLKKPQNYLASICFLCIDCWLIKCWIKVRLD